MIEEIKEKLKRLEGRKPFRGEWAEEIQRSHKVDWAYSCLHLGGSSVTKDMVERVVMGRFVEEATIEDHRLIERLEDTFKEATSLLEMDFDLDEEVLERLGKGLFPEGKIIWRRGNPLNLEYHFTPVYAKDISEELGELFRWLYNQEVSPEIGRNPLLRAAYLYNRFLEIYPFDEYCEEMACVIMHYYLMQHDYPPFVLRFSPWEYHQAVECYLKRNDISNFYNCLERSLYNKCEVLLQLTTDPEE